MEIFFCQPINRGALTPGTKAAIAIVVFLVFAGAIAYLMLAKASKFRRFLALSAIRIKGPPRNGRMSLVVTDIEGYSGVCGGGRHAHMTATAVQAGVVSDVLSKTLHAPALRVPAHVVLPGGGSPAHNGTDSWLVLCVQTSSSALQRSCSRLWCCTTLCSGQVGSRQ